MATTTTAPEPALATDGDGVTAQSMERRCRDLDTSTVADLAFDLQVSETTVTGVGRTVSCTWKPSPNAPVTTTCITCIDVQAHPTSQAFTDVAEKWQSMGDSVIDLGPLDFTTHAAVVVDTGLLVPTGDLLVATPAAVFQFHDEGGPVYHALGGDLDHAFGASVDIPPFVSSTLASLPYETQEQVAREIRLARLFTE